MPEQLFRKFFKRQAVSSISGGKMDNRLKTVLFLGTLTGLLLLIGQLVGGVRGLAFALVFALAMNAATYWWSDRIVLAMYRAKPADKNKHSKLYRLCEETARLVKIPVPKIYIIESATPNAFATGRSPSRSAIAFTTAILELLEDDELKGVIAHEMSHVRNRDTLISTIAATIAAVVSYVAFMARWAAIFGGFGSRDNDRGGNILELLVLAIVAPLVATILQLAISRSREFLADETGAKALHTGQGLARALEKLEAGVKHRPMRQGNPATASLFIVNPFTARTLMTLFSTHPPTSERVKRLRRIG